MTEKMDTDLEDTTIQNIPIPLGPQVNKSSNEILCELFGAFNATPPPLVATLSHDNQSSSLQKLNKKHKKHSKPSKKKHRKVKKKKRSSSSSSFECKKNVMKKSKKDKVKPIETKSVSSNKERKRKLEKFSASDDSEEDKPKTKKNQCNEDKMSISVQNSDKIKIKKEKDGDSASLGFSILPDSIKENIFKHAVSQIVDKVIDSTNLATEVCNNIACMQETNIHFRDEVIQRTVKEEPTNSAQFSKVGLAINKEHNSSKNLQTSEVTTKSIPVADVFAEDLLDCGIDKDTAVITDKLKSSGGKITIKNLKFSQLYEATVKQVEDEAKLKAEKYEEGELSDSSSEERDKSQTPSESSVAGSVKDLGKTKCLEEKERLHKHKRVKKHHRQSSDRKRSVSRERFRSNSSRNQSHSHRHKETHRTQSRDEKRTRSRERNKNASKDQTENKTKEIRGRGDKRRSPDKSRERSRSKETKRSKDRVQDWTKDKSQEGCEKTKRKRSRSRDRDKRNSEEKIDKIKLLEIARKNALTRMKIPAGTLDQTKVAITSGGKTVNELTDFCKLLSQKDADGHDSISSNTSNSSDSESEKPFHHPFQLKDRPSSIVLNIREIFLQ